VLQIIKNSRGGRRHQLVLLHCAVVWSEHRAWGYSTPARHTAGAGACPVRRVGESEAGVAEVTVDAMCWQKQSTAALQQALALPQKSRPGTGMRPGVYFMLLSRPEGLI